METRHETSDFYGLSKSDVLSQASSPIEAIMEQFYYFPAHLSICEWRNFRPKWHSSGMPNGGFRAV